MRDKGMIAASVLVVAAMAAMAVHAADTLPPRAVLPIHWGLDGRPDNFARKGVALAIGPIITIAVSLLFAALPRIEPMKQGLAQSWGLYRTVWAGMLGLMLVVQLLPVGVALHWGLDVARLMPAALGVFLLLIGNALAKSRPMRLIGIRTRWTLADTDNWIATHRLAGKLIAGAGAIWLLAALFAPMGPVTMLLLSVLLPAAALLPVPYSAWRARAPSEDRRG